MYCHLLFTKIIVDKQLINWTETTISKSVNPLWSDYFDRATNPHLNLTDFEHEIRIRQMQILAGSVTSLLIASEEDWTVCLQLFVMVYLELGNELMRLEQYSAAVNSYTRAIVLDNKNAVYYCNRSVVRISFLELIFSAVRKVFFHFESNRILELLFEISNRIE